MKRPASSAERRTGSDDKAHRRKKELRTPSPSDNLTEAMERTASSAELCTGRFLTKAELQDEEGHDEGDNSDTTKRAKEGGASDSDSDSSRNPCFPARTQWEYHQDGWWRGMMCQASIEAAFNLWQQMGSPKPPTSLHVSQYDSVLYTVNFKSFTQSACVVKDDGTVNLPRRVRSIRRVSVISEQDTKRKYM